MTEQSAAATQGTPRVVRHTQKTGVVISNKMDKTIVVAVEMMKKHHLYKRTYKQTKHFYAHDEDNACQIGDVVRIEETRPLSKLKRWRLVEIMRKGSGIVPVKEVLAEADPNVGPESAESEEEQAEE
jgi:small subunit ribosomal protein S17